VGELPIASEAQDELNALVRKVRAAFFVPPEGEEVLFELSQFTSALSPPFVEIAGAYRANIIGLLATISFPYTLAHAAALDRHYQRLSSAERIRSLKLLPKQGESSVDLTQRRDAAARETADHAMVQFLGSSEGRDAVIHDSISFLARSLGTASLSESANELVLQGLVLCWGAFEVLARDCFVALLNLRPTLAEQLLKDPVAKRRFELAKVSLETLAAHDFNLSKKMGVILAEQQDLSDIHSIKAVYEALFPADTKLRDAIGSTDLRVLSQRRNLVVHRRGIIDEVYIRATDPPQKAGEKLRLEPDELEKQIQSSARAAAEILKAVNE